MRGALGEAVAGRAVRIGVCVCVTATSVTATQDQWVCIINNEGALKKKTIIQNQLTSFRSVIQSNSADRATK